MVKTTRTSKRAGTRPNKLRTLGSKANAAGYAKRHSRKAKSLNEVSNVYEYQPEKVRRSKVTMELDRDEAAEFGFGGEEEDDVEERDQLKARLVGENGEDEKIDSGDDEEIDSDGAFEESDEEAFAGFFSAKVRPYLFFQGCIAYGTERRVRRRP
jgi:U3 small nucleolar RNA-associated protein 14